MDLRKYITCDGQLEQGLELIRQNLLFYQPYILADDLEVGEGYNFCEQYRNVETVFDMNVYAGSRNVGKRKQPSDPAYFRQCNQEYRAIYDFITEQLCLNLEGDISGLAFAELGCNTGLNLFNLTRKGARECYGFDSNDLTPIFSWMNSLLGTKVRFTTGNYCNLTHKFLGGTVPEVDVMINTVFLNHQCDPLQFLSYMCDRARVGVFLWVLIEPVPNGECVVRYPRKPPHDILETGRPFPLYFNNNVRVSEPLLKLSLERLGFGDFRPIREFFPSEKWQAFQSAFRMYFAKRTSKVRSAYWGLAEGH
jgi:hypothetical protein